MKSPKKASTDPLQSPSKEQDPSNHAQKESAPSNHAQKEQDPSNGISKESQPSIEPTNPDVVTLAPEENVKYKTLLNQRNSIAVDYTNTHMRLKTLEAQYAKARDDLDTETQMLDRQYRLGKRANQWRYDMARGAFIRQGPPLEQATPKKERE